MASREIRTDAGFTLVEMLVSLTLMGLAALLMLEGLGSGQRLWAGQAARTAGGESVGAAQAILRTRIEGLRPVTRFDSANAYADIDGGQRQLVFLANPPEVDRPSAARRYRLIVGDRGELMLGSAPAAPADPRSVDAGSEPDYTDQLLLRDVGGLDISYYGPGPDGGAPHWQADWTKRVDPPELVRIRVALKGGDGRVWPELIVHPAAMVDSLCTIDATTGACRGRT
jgi:general secretion pathway protein J